jgi:hypothetical protein
MFRRDDLARSMHFADSLSGVGFADTVTRHIGFGCYPTAPDDISHGFLTFFATPVFHTQHEVWQAEKHAHNSHKKAQNSDYGRRVVHSQVLPDGISACQIYTLGRKNLPEIHDIRTTTGGASN